MLLKHGFSSPFQVLNWRIKFQVLWKSQKFSSSLSGLLRALFWLKDNRPATLNLNTSIATLKGIGLEGSPFKQIRSWDATREYMRGWSHSVLLCTLFVGTILFIWLQGARPRTETTWPRVGGEKEWKLGVRQCKQPSDYQDLTLNHK